MNKIVLIIEDDINFMAALQAKLSVEGFIARTAKNGEEAMQKLGEKVDLIVLDVILPDMTGFDILKRIKNDPETKDIPVVIVSNLSDQGSKDKGTTLGAKDYIVKPDYKIDEIVEKIKFLSQ